MSLASILAGTSAKGSTSLASLLGGESRKRKTLPAAKKSRGEQNAALNEKYRAQIAEAGEQDPTKTEPTVLERILTPLQASQQAASVLIDALIRKGWKGDKELGITTSDAERAKYGAELVLTDRNTGKVEPLASPVKAFTDAWGGKTTIEGSQVVGNLEKRMGFDTPLGAFGQGVAGFAYDVATDPLTWTTFGLTQAGKSSAKDAVRQVAKGGLKTSALEGLGYKADDIARLVASYGDDTGHIVIEGMPKSVVNDLTARVTVAAANDIKGGRGLLGAAGKAGESAQMGLTRASIATKDALHTLPGAGLFDRMFLKGERAPGYDLLDNAAQKAGIDLELRDVGGKLGNANHVGSVAGDEVRKALPDARLRSILSIGISRALGDETSRATIGALEAARDGALKIAKDASDDAIRETAQNSADTASQRLAEALASSYDPDAVLKTLTEFGVTDPEQVAKATSVADDVGARMTALWQKQADAGVPLKSLFGKEGTEGIGYLPGMEAVERPGKTLKQFLTGAKSERQVYDDTLVELGEQLGFNPDDLRQGGRGFIKRVRQLKPEKGTQKKYLTVEDRLRDIVRGTDAPAGKMGVNTETDVAHLVARATSEAEGRIALKEFRDSVSKITTNKEALGFITRVENFMSDDAAVTGFFKMFDAAQGIFKKQATVWRMPAFQLRNKGSNASLMAINDAFDPEAWVRAPLRLMGIDRKPISLGARSVIGKVVDADSLDDMARGLGVIAGRGKHELYGNQVSRGLTKWGAEVNSKLVEDADRYAVFVAGLRKGMTPEASAAFVDNTLYSYDPQLLTYFERAVMRRAAPFYIWQRRNLPHMMETIAKRPGFMSMVVKAQRNMADAYGIDESLLEDWKREAGYIAIGPEDDPTTLSVQGVLPMGDLADAVPTPSNTLARLSPLIKDPFEIAANYEFFSDQPLESPNQPGEKRRSPGVIQALDALLGGAERGLIGAEERTNATTGEKYIATNNRYFNKLLRDSSPFLGQVGKVVSPKDDYELVSGLTGLRGYSYDPASLAYSKSYDDRAALQGLVTMLRKEGRIAKKSTKSRSKKKNKTANDSLLELLKGGK